MGVHVVLTLDILFGLIQIKIVALMTIGHLICTLISENKGLWKLRSVSNLRKILGPAHLNFFFSTPEVFVSLSPGFFQVYSINLKKKRNYLCLILLQVPKCFMPVQIFWASPKIWLHLVHLQKLLCCQKTNFTECKSSFCPAQNVLDRHNM